LYLEVAPKGGKWWRYKYRFGGKEKRISLGTYPDISLAKARERLLEARRLLADGIDPSEARKSSKVAARQNAGNTFEHIAREWWASHMKNKADTHKDKVIRRFEIYMFPWLGKKPISEISSPQVLEVVNRIVGLNFTETAKRTLQTTGQVFRYAVQKGLAIRDVTADLKGALPTTEVKHMAAFTNAKDVGDLLKAIDAFKGTLTVKCALKLSPLIFVRPGELRKAKWSEIDFNERQWRYLVGKINRPHIVPLSTQAINILKTIQAVSGEGEYVFPGQHSRLRPMSEAAINTALQRMGYDTQTEITGHGFRAMARTILHEELNIDPAIIEHQLSHLVPDPLGEAYNRTKFIKQRTAMMQIWADHLDKLKNS
jgi:integrase